MDNSPKHSKTILFFLKYSICLLCVLTFISCEDVFEEYTDCVADCTGPELFKREIINATMDPFIHKEDSNVWTFQITDSIYKSDFGLRINFDGNDKIIREAKGCCGTEMVSEDYVRHIDLFVINTVTGETTDASQFFSLSHSTDEEQITIQKFNENLSTENLDYLDLRLISPARIPASAVFDMKVTISSFIKFSDQSATVYFKD